MASSDEVAEILSGELARLRAVERPADVIAKHSGQTTHREWWSGGEWLYPGDEIVKRDSADAIRAAASQGGKGEDK